MFFVASYSTSSAYLRNLVLPGTSVNAFRQGNAHSDVKESQDWMIEGNLIDAEF